MVSSQRSVKRPNARMVQEAMKTPYDHRLEVLEQQLATFRSAARNTNLTSGEREQWAGYVVGCVAEIERVTLLRESFMKHERLYGKK